MNSFTCFGEVLWDVFPDHEKIGGAPLNVALRLKSFNNNVSVISSVGQDILGKKLEDYLNNNGLATEYLQIHNSQPTGKVNVTLDSQGVASYEIKQPVAWDFIEINEANINLVKNSEVFIYGSLVARNEISKHTLFGLLNHASFKVFDVNLRPPFYSLDLLKALMKQADFIKFNEEEIDLIIKGLNATYSSIEENMAFLSKTFNASHLCVTKGDKGAVLLMNDQFYYNDGYIITVKDTVGAGDSFLASLLYKITQNSKPQAALDFACAVGALVAGHEGANPEILNSDVLDMIG